MTDSIFPEEVIRRYITKDCQSVPGFLQTGSMAVTWSLIEAQNDMEVGGNVAEIGVYQGKFLIFLSLTLRPGERAFAFDSFIAPQGKEQENQAKLIENLERFGIGEDMRKVFRTDTRALDRADLLRALGGKTVRLFSVDGNHSKRAVAHDLHLAAWVTKEDGVIIADDIFNSWTPETTEGILEFFRTDQDNWEPISITAANQPISTGAPKLFIAHASHANAYKRYLRVLNRENFVKTAKFAGFDVLVFDFAERVTKSPLDERSRKLIGQLAAKSLSA